MAARRRVGADLRGARSSGARRAVPTREHDRHVPSPPTRGIHSQRRRFRLRGSVGLLWGDGGLVCGPDGARLARALRDAALLDAVPLRTLRRLLLLARALTLELSE